jgi:membrane protein implicated in regulation of membrane protease activity
VPLIWLIAGVVLALAELFTLDFVLVMFAVGALGASAAGSLGAPVPAQVVVFAVMAVLGLVTVRPALRRRHPRRPATVVAGHPTVDHAPTIVVDESGGEREE